MTPFQRDAKISMIADAYALFNTGVNAYAEVLNYENASDSEKAASTAILKVNDRFHAMSELVDLEYQNFAGDKLEKVQSLLYSAEAELEYSEYADAITGFEIGYRSGANRADGHRSYSGIAATIVTRNSLR